VLVLFVMAALAGPASASADSASAKKIETMNRLAMDDYEMGFYPAAQKQLEDALTLAKTQSLDKHAIVAQTNLNLGIVLAGGLKQTDKAVAAFRAALAIDPALAPAPSLLKKAEIAKAFENAKKPEERKDVKPEGPVKGIFHNPVPNAKEGEDVAVRAWCGDELRAAAVVLSYRKKNTDPFTPVDMKPASDGGYAAMIPANATATDTLQYMIEVKNKKAKLVAKQGPFSIDVARKPKAAEEAAKEETAVDTEEAPIRNFRNYRNYRD
jgi:tetratricopeptide (TPR) repeat protein